MMRNDAADKSRRETAEGVPLQDVTYRIRWKADRRAFEVLRNGAATGTFGYSKARAIELAIVQARAEDTAGEVSVISRIDDRDYIDWRRAARCTTWPLRSSPILPV
jgi:hypothetical protein